MNTKTIAVYFDGNFSGYTESLEALNKFIGDGDTIEVKINPSGCLGVNLEYHVTTQEGRKKAKAAEEAYAPIMHLFKF